MQPALCCMSASVNPSMLYSPHWSCPSPQDACLVVRRLCKSHIASLHSAGASGSTGEGERAHTGLPGLQGLQGLSGWAQQADAWDDSATCSASH